MVDVSKMPIATQSAWGEPWTETEDEFLRRTYKRYTARSIGAVLGRTARAVQCRAEVLSLDGDRSSWSEEDDATLAELFPAMSSKQVAQRMNRSVYSINRRVHDLRLRGDDRFPYKRAPKAPADRQAK